LTASVGVLLVASAGRLGVAYWLVGFTIMNFLIAAIIDSLVSEPESPATRILDTRPFVLIGSLSYGLYLFQQPLIFHKKYRFFPFSR
jgi:peptidoglycan/LPS O-acetylase OafA/YrhL